MRSGSVYWYPRRYILVGKSETAYINNYIDHYNNWNSKILKQDLITKLYDPINDRDFTVFNCILFLKFTNLNKIFY